jgi:nucleoside-diphosphate-sugar epimerase
MKKIGLHRHPPFGAPRLLVVGCGDVGMRLLPLLRNHFRIFALTSSGERFAQLREAGAVPVLGNLDDSRSLARLGRLASLIVHLAPPQSEGEQDLRTRRLAAILPEGARMVYVSTTGVYGDCQGARFDETRTTAPVNARARRRVDAERVLRHWASRSGSKLSILRVPGIYAGDRLPLERLQRGTPALADDDDVYTNHIHADDLARIIRMALMRGAPQRVYHASDDTELKMGAYFDLVADAFDLPRAPRLGRQELGAKVSPMMLSFMSESRRLMNDRMKQELGVRLRWPDVQSFLNL